MTQKLEVLKGVLQKVLGESVENNDYLMALEDAQYACGLGHSALNTIFQAWCMMPNDEILACPHEIDYFRGCCFVADEWDQVLSEDRGERL